MAYTPTNWVNDVTALNATRMNHIESGIDDVDQALTDHLADTSDAHDASAISVLDTDGNFTGTDVEAVLAELFDAIGAGSSGAVRAVRTSSQSISASTETAIQFNSTDAFDTDGYHDPSTDNTKIIIPTGKDGIYLIQGETNWVAEASGDRVLYIKKNNTDYIANSSTRGGGAFGESQQVSTIAQLAAGDYVEIRAYQSASGSLTVSNCWFAAVKV